MKHSFLLSAVQLALILLAVAAVPSVQAGSATWNLNPTTGDWNTTANWTPETVPNGPTDVATFGLSNVIDPFVNTNIEVAEVFFEADASAYEISLKGLHTFTLSGAGVVNNSGETQAFLLGGASTLKFSNTASAGDLTEIAGGTVSFFDQASAASATLTVDGGLITFNDHSTADHALFLVGGSTCPAVW